MQAPDVYRRRFVSVTSAGAMPWVCGTLGLLMNILLWVLQALAALVYGASGVMKAFMFDEISRDVPTFGALPPAAWMALGVLELVCVAGLIVPAVLRRRTSLIPLAAAALAAESLVLIWAHAQYGETPQIAMVAALGVVMAFVAYGRAKLRPIADRSVQRAIG